MFAVVLKFRRNSPSFSECLPWKSTQFRAYPNSLSTNLALSFKNLLKSWNLGLCPESIIFPTHVALRIIGSFLASSLNVSYHWGRLHISRSTELTFGLRRCTSWSFGVSLELLLVIHCTHISLPDACRLVHFHSIKRTLSLKLNRILIMTCMKLPIDFGI